MDFCSSAGIRNTTRFEVGEGVGLLHTCSAAHVLARSLRDYTETSGGWNDVGHINQTYQARCHRVGFFAAVSRQLQACMQRSAMTWNQNPPCDCTHRLPDLQRTTPGPQVTDAGLMSSNAPGGTTAAISATPYGHRGDGQSAIGKSVRSPIFNHDHPRNSLLTALLEHQ